MKIDLCCDFGQCCFCSDGSCTRPEEYKRCTYISAVKTIEAMRKNDDVLNPGCYQCKTKPTCLSLVGTNYVNRCIWWGYLVDHAEKMKG